MALTVTVGQTVELNPAAVIYKLPDQIEWKGTGGNRNAVLVGDPEKPGLYIVINKWLAGNNFSRPHFHPNDRFITVLKGTWWVGTGNKFDPANTVPMPAGSFVTHFGKQVSQVCALQGVVADDRHYGEQPENLWSAKKRPKRMVKLIEEHLGRIPETEPIQKLLEDACDPTNKRNQLAQGTWWAFDPKTATIHVRGGIQRANEDQFSEHSEETISAIADSFESLEARLYKLRSDIENRHGDSHSFDWSPPPCT